VKKVTHKATKKTEGKTGKSKDKKTEMEDESSLEKRQTRSGKNI
jgi:hypothetical protein